LSDLRRRQLDKKLAARISAHYPHASPLQRWHLRGRLYLCPYDALLKHLTGAENLLDIGCGFGHLAWYLAEIGAPLRYYGVDIDKRKIDLALGCPILPTTDSSTGLLLSPTTPRPSFSFGDVRELAGLPARFGNIVLLDTLYLMSWKLQTSILDWALAHLCSGPKSALVIKTMDEAVGFSGFRTVAEEWIMVHMLRRTRSSGTINGVRSFGTYIDFANDRGYRCQIEHLPTFNPSSILRMHR
jgi:SAM-dependent methyltransferase